MVHEVCIFGEPCPGVVNRRKSRVATVAFLLGHGHRPNRETVPCPAVEQKRVVGWYPWW